ncbi:amino acid racemase, partial [Candidatus Bipolaricaulota bacterium]|nr:amino acid racemase [Candidatus Bipolaricaulota bacterium]
MGRDRLYEKQTIGILGGMGPEATIECYKSIIDQTPADTDQEHLSIVIVNNPQIPDRTEAILYDGDSPVPALQDSARVLEVAGADFLIMPCNTAHHFVSEVEKAIEVPVLNMIETTVDQLEPGSTVGLLATMGTIKTGIYEKYSRERGNV